MISDEERIAVALRYIEAGQQLANRTSNSEAQRNWQYILNHGMVIVPLCADGNKVSFRRVMAIDRVKCSAAHPILRILPIFPQDAQLNYPWRENLGHNASYRTAENMICLLSDFADTPFGYGVTMLHEGGHARRAYEEGRIGLPSQQREWTQHHFLEEGDMMWLNAQLFRERGGTTYAALIDKAVFRIEKVLRNNFGLYAMPPDHEWIAALDQLFEVSCHGRNIDGFWSGFIMLAHLEMVERSQWRDKRNRRGEIVKMIIEMIGHEKYW